MKLHYDYNYGYFLVMEDVEGRYSVRAGLKCPELYVTTFQSVDPDWTIESTERVVVARFQSSDYESPDGMGTRTSGSDKPAATRLARKSWSRAAGGNFAEWVESAPQLPNWCCEVRQPKTADGTPVMESLPRMVTRAETRLVKSRHLGRLRQSEAEDILIDAAIEAGIDL